MVVAAQIDGSKELSCMSRGAWGGLEDGRAYVGGATATKAYFALLRWAVPKALHGGVSA